MTQAKNFIGAGLPAAWAIQRSIERCDETLGGKTLGRTITPEQVLKSVSDNGVHSYYWLIAHARDIEKYEQPPVAAEVMAARQYAARAHREGSPTYRSIMEGFQDKTNIRMQRFLEGVKWARANEE